MSQLILPRSITRSNATDNAMADERHEDAAYHAQALTDGISRTVKWAKTPPIYEDGDRVTAVTEPGAERVVHERIDRTNLSGKKVRVYDVKTARPCPGCGKPLYGIGEVQTSTAPWHLACWEMEQAAQAFTVPMEFDAEGLPAAEGRAKGRGRPRRRRR